MNVITLTFQIAKFMIKYLSRKLEMLQNDFDKIDTTSVESDNCFNQYKCAQHFYHLKSISNKFKTVTSVAEHVKGEVVDNVGGLAKVIIHQQVAASDVFLSSSMMADYLDAKFKGSANPEYIVKEIGSSLFSPKNSPQQLAIAEGFTKANSVFTVITSAKILPR